MAMNPVDSFLRGFAVVDQLESNRQNREFARKQQSRMELLWERDDQEWERAQLDRKRAEYLVQLDVEVERITAEVGRETERLRKENGDEAAAEYVEQWYAEGFERIANEALNRINIRDPEFGEHVALALKRNIGAGPLVRDPRRPVAGFQLIGPDKDPGGKGGLTFLVNSVNGSQPETERRSADPDDPVVINSLGMGEMVEIFGQGVMGNDLRVSALIREAVGFISPDAGTQEARKTGTTTGGAGTTTGGAGATTDGAGATTDGAGATTGGEAAAANDAAAKITANIDATDEQILAGRTPSPYAPTEFDTDYFQSGSSYQDALTGSPGVVRSDRWEFAPHKRLNKLARPGPEDYLQDPMAVNVYPQDFKDDVDTSGGKKSSYRTGHRPSSLAATRSPTLHTAEEKYQAATKGRKPEPAQGPVNLKAVQAETDVKKIPKDDAAPEDVEKTARDLPLDEEGDKVAAEGLIKAQETKAGKKPNVLESYWAYKMVGWGAMTGQDYLRYLQTGKIGEEPKKKLHFFKDGTYVEYNETQGVTGVGRVPLSGDGSGADETKYLRNLRTALNDIVRDDKGKVDYTKQNQYIREIEAARVALNMSRDQALSVGNIEVFQEGLEAIENFDPGDEQGFWKTLLTRDPEIGQKNLALGYKMIAQYNIQDETERNRFLYNYAIELHKANPGLNTQQMVEFMDETEGFVQEAIKEKRAANPEWYPSSKERADIRSAIVDQAIYDTWGELMKKKK